MGKQIKKKSKSKPKESPPFEISIDEYKDLLLQVSKLSILELQEELISAARYGDIDVVHAILAVANDNKNSNNNKTSYLATDLINFKNLANGSTALHMAAANGHIHVAEALLETGVATHTINEAENTPLHWAAANGHEKMVELLLLKVPDIDVLVKNKFGRSALTEGFTSQNTELVKFLLEHDSASEERLIQGIASPPSDPNMSHNTGLIQNGKENSEYSNKNQSTEAEKNSRSCHIIHQFAFGVGTSHAKQVMEESSSLNIRELPIDHADDPFGQKPEHDTTGYGIWAASLIMSQWMASCAERFLVKLF